MILFLKSFILFDLFNHAGVYVQRNSIVADFRIFIQAIHHRSSVFRSLFAYKLGYGEWECAYWLLPAAMQPPGCLVKVRV